MREHSFLVREALQSGLRGDVRTPKNADVLEDMTNFKPTPFGAVTPPDVTYPISDPVLSMAWPWPVIIRGESSTLLVDETSVRNVDESDWSTSTNLIWDAGDPSQQKSIESGAIWGMVSFSDIWFLTNGTSFVFSAPANTDSKILTVTTPTVQSMASHRNRLLLGGLAGAHFATDRWGVLFDAWRDLSAARRLEVTHEDMTLGTGWVLWGHRGGGAADIPFHLITTAMGIHGDDDFDAYEMVMKQAFETGEMGLAYMTTPGAIKAMERLGDSVIAYGDKGVSRLSPDDTSFYRETSVLSMGISGRGAVAGDDTEHVFIDTFGNIWQYRVNERPKKLGYSEYIGEMNIQAIIITHDPEQGDFWISDGDTAYVLTPNGLGGPMSIIPSSMWRDDDGSLVGTSTVETVDELTASVTTHPTDIGERDTKHVTNVQVTSEALSSLGVQVAWRQATGVAYALTPLQKTNLHGSAFPIASFVDGKLTIEGTVDVGGNARLERIEWRYNAEGRQNTRGTKGTPQGS